MIPWGGAVGPAAAGSPWPGVETGPFERSTLLRRVAPFAAGAALAELSLALPPGPHSAGWTVVSVALVALSALCMLAPFGRLPRYAPVVVPLVYIASVLALVLAAGSATSGLAVVILIPLVWTALYHTRLESVIVVLGVVGFEVAISLEPQEVAGAVLVRRAVFWLLLGLVVSEAIHALRRNAARALEDERELRRQTAALTAVAEEMATIHDPDGVFARASQALVALTSGPGAPTSRALFLKVRDGRVTVSFESDPAGQHIETGWPVEEHPWLSDVVRTGVPAAAAIDTTSAGPTVRKAMEDVGIRHGVWIPVAVDGSVQGVMALGVRTGEVTPRMFDMCVAVGHLTELALSNAVAHQQLRAQAISDPLTGLANRRHYDQLVQARPRHSSFAVLAIDLDHLKQINDAHGHEAGDELLVSVARVLRQELRHGDVLGRLGGDEFAAYLPDAGLDQAGHAAQRMLDAVGGLEVRGTRPSISVGVAVADEDPREALHRADLAMYEAKREGGMRWRVAARPAVPSA